MSFSKLFKVDINNNVGNATDSTDFEDISFGEYCKNNQIEPLDKPNKIYHKPKSIAPKVIQSISKNNDISDYFSEYVAHAEFSQSNQKHLIKALKNGKYKITASIDLHNNTQSRAMNLLEIFLNNHSTPSGCCLKIIHGKGLGSANGVSVLKNMVRRYLEHNSRVLAYVSASINQGGDGVTLVKLRN